MELVLIIAEVSLGLFLLAMGYGKLSWLKSEEEVSPELSASMKKITKLCGYSALGLALINLFQYFSDSGVV